MSYEGLEIRPGGLLIYSYWDKNLKSFKERDVTNETIGRLFEICRLAEDLTLQDIFLLINSQAELFTLLLGPWIDDLITEGLSPKTGDNNIEYLELYWSFTYDIEPISDEKVLAETGFPKFHGVGPIRNSGTTESSDPSCDENGRTNYSISLSKANNLAPLPIKLKKEARLYDGIEEKTISFDNSEYTLGQIIYGIFWELTFYGNTSMRESMTAELTRRIENINSGKDKLLSWEELKEQIKKKLNG